MAKLYRIIPDTTSTVISTGYLSDITEDLLYQLGFLSYGDHGLSYFGTYEEGKGNSGESSRDYIFFFNSPWSCVRGLNFLSDPYGNEVARILEYDIQDEIVKESRDAFTNYTNYQAKGKKIPVKLLEKDKEVFDEFSQELRTKLEEIALQDSSESIKQFCQSVQKSRFSIHKNNPHINVDYLSQLIFEPSLKQKVNNRRFKKSGNFFRTSAITGRTMVITRADRELMEDILFNKKKIDDLSTIMDKSNGILTLDGLKNYDKDASEHQYDMIISYD